MRTIRFKKKMIYLFIELGVCCSVLGYSFSMTLWDISYRIYPNKKPRGFVQSCFPMSAVADLGGTPGMCSPMDQNFFNFIGFFGKKY